MIPLTWCAVAALGLLMTILVLFAYIGIPLGIWASWKRRRGIRRSSLPFKPMSDALAVVGWKNNIQHPITAS